MLGVLGKTGVSKTEYFPTTSCPAAHMVPHEDTKCQLGYLNSQYAVAIFEEHSTLH